MTKVGIVGGSGYVAGELIRCLINHPKVTIDFIYSHSQSGEKVKYFHQDLLYLENLSFVDTINPTVDVVFLCLGHGNSKKFLNENKFSNNTRIIDLSNDFRLKEKSIYSNREFVYGLVELNKEKIKNAKNIANPGCFATAIQLALLPLAKENKIQDDVHVHAVTGSTGAGNNFMEETHFSWRNNNVSIYKPFSHQHIDEITESVVSLQSNFKHDINFIPMRGNFTRGIFASVYTKIDWDEEKLVSIYENYYSAHLFTKLSKEALHLKQVSNTNFAFMRVRKIKDKVLITCIIDNLLKGAVGQAIQNMNLMLGFDEDMSLHFIANYF